MYFLIDIANFKSEEKKRKPVKGSIQIAGGAYVGQQAVRSGVPRLLGVRLEQHTTKKSNYKDIVNSGGYLDPALGGSSRGAGASLGGEAGDTFKLRSKGLVHITGVSPQDTRIPRSPVFHALYRKQQSALYGGMARKEGGTAKTLYVPGTDEYFAKNFSPDPDDIALKTTQKVKVYGNRFSATAAQVKKQGLIKGILLNKGRVLTGAGLAGAGGYGAYSLIKSGVNNATGGEVKVKGFFRKGKVVKNHSRKRLNK